MITITKIAPFSLKIFIERWIPVFKTGAQPVSQETLCQVVEKNGRRFEADGAQAKAPVILYAECRCQEVSDVG